MIIWLRTNSYDKVYVACGEIENVELKEDVLILNTTDYAKQVLKDNNNINILHLALKSLGYNYNIKLHSENKEDKTNQTIETLKKLFGDKLKI